MSYVNTTETEIRTALKNYPAKVCVKYEGGEVKYLKT
jgi:hypothetical protein